MADAAPAEGRIEDVGLSSERRVDALLSRFIHLGYVESFPSEQDGRVRILTPTPKMMSIDREWLAYHYAPLHTMFPERGYGEPMRRDIVFQRAQRLVALDFSAQGAQIMASHPAVMRFMSRDAGMLVLIKLVQMRLSAKDGAKGLTYAEIGKRFGVSRTHVRALLEDAAQHGDVTLFGRGGRLVQGADPASLRPLLGGCDVGARSALQARARADGEGNHLAEIVEPTTR